MRSIVFDQLGAADSVLRLVDREVPEPAAGEVRVRVVVSGVNPTDWKARTGLYGGEAVESVPNQDGSGVIDAVGAGVDQVAVGDRVWFTLAAFQRPMSGSAQEYTTLPVERVFPLADSASFEIGASVGVPAITAHRALTVAEDGPTRLSPGALEGKVILVAGGAGAVGHAAIQLARWAGATVIATTSPGKTAYAESAGAHHVVNYREEDAAAQIRSFAPDGVDVIVEVAAGANNELNLAVLRPLGTIAIYANDGNQPLALDIRANMGLNARYQFLLLYGVGPKLISAAAEDVSAAIAAGVLPVGEDAGLPLHTFDLARTAEAHQAVEAGATGKVLITVSES
ncbi:NADPH:quinone reductase [Kribbella ginsengisoli]|uniref:NADPH:quinone reductase n=1 Tax=Kribbella ginsengisoli TaxID=363865 RepID=UPI0031D81C92